jgi:16S rRNA (guanine966-N2)-methyltransferase
VKGRGLHRVTRLSCSLQPDMRITGGIHRSRPLKAPKGVSTRPTADRVREAMFSILASRRTLDGARVLDLYAGTGALGLEAISRGAAWATFVECSRTALGALRENIELLRVKDQVHVVAGLAERSGTLIEGDGLFDFVLADPPYALVRSGEAAETLGALVKSGIVEKEGIVVLEHGKGDASPLIENLSVLDVRTYGDTVLAFYVGPAPGDP